MNYWLSFGSSAVSGLAPTFIQWRTTAGGTLAPPSITEPGSFGLYSFSYNALTQIAFICDGATSGLSFSDRYIQGVVDPSDNFGFTLSAIAATQSAYAPIIIPGYSITVQSYSLGIQNFSLGIDIRTISTQGFSQSVENYSAIVQSYSLAVQSYSLISQGSSVSIEGFSLTVALYSLAIQGSSLIGDTASSFGTSSVDPTSVFGFLKRAQEDREGNETYVKASGILDTYSRGSSVLLVQKTISDTSTETTKT